MTVAELIERLNGLPPGLEIRVNRKNEYGGIGPAPAKSADIERDDRQDPSSKQFVLIQ